MTLVRWNPLQELDTAVRAPKTVAATRHNVAIVAK